MTSPSKQAAARLDGARQSALADAGAADPQAHARLQLLDLAEDASRYLRRHADPTVRVAAALLLASSLAACSSSRSGPAASTEAPAVAPLAQEVKTGLPTNPGTYPVSSSSLTRDAQGVYGFTWRNATGTEVWTPARASLVKLAQGPNDVLEVPASGDPTLRLKPDTAIMLPDDDTPVGGLTPTPRTSSSSTTGSSRGSSILWYPFPGVGGTTSTGTTGSTGTTASSGAVADTTPAYRNPPAVTPGQGSVRGSASSSVSAPTTSARTWTSPSRAAATGQAGGPGPGTAAASRAGALSGPASGAARPGSSIFSGGKSGASSSSSSSSG
jgi:hypothetical protein